jgi:hypothetical protein
MKITLKLMGSPSNMRSLNSFILHISFNEQYSYFYMLMARRNLISPLGDSKNTLIKFNEQIASKYRSGLSLRFLDSYKKNVVPNSIKQFYIQNQVKQVSRIDFENILKSNTEKDNWFFKTIIDSRDIIDYKFSSVAKPMTASLSQ